MNGYVVSFPKYGTVFEVQADNVTIKNLQVGGAQYGIHFTGVSGGNVEHVRATAIAGPDNGDSAGFRLSGTTGTLLTDIEVTGVKGGNGSSGHVGRHGSGVLIHDSDTTHISGCQLQDITGGQGGYYNHVGGLGSGIYVRSNSDQTVVENCTIFNVEGGQGGHSGKGPGNQAAGLYQNSGTGLLVRSTLVYDIRGGPKGQDQTPHSYSSCLRSQDVGTVGISNFTCVGSDNIKQRGIQLDNSPGAVISITSSIIANVSSVCLSNGAQNPQGAIMLSDSNLFDCQGGQAENALVSATNIAADPLFVNTETADYHLQATSPCIDVGGEGVTYCLEPQPNGCRVNMGAYGNTTAATTKEGAGHCPCL